MPIATGGGSKPKKPSKPSPDPSSRPASQSQRIGNAVPNPPKPPKPYTGTETGLGGNTGISQAAKEARQARQSEAKHEARRLIESKRQSIKGGNVTKGGAGSSQGTLGVTRANNTPSETRSYQSQKRIGRAINAPGVKDPYRAGITRPKGTGSPGSTSGAGSRSQVTRGGSSFGDAKAPRTASYDGVPRRGGTEYGGGRIGGTNPITISEGRIGGGFKEFGSGYRPPPAYFDTGAGGGGGVGGGAANPLAGGANFGGESLEEVLHGAKKKGRVKRARRTE